MTPAQQKFLQRNQLPESYLEAAYDCYKPLLDSVAQEQQQQQKTGHAATRVIGINGSQGSGKSTLADYLCMMISEQQSIRALALSLDDFYLPRADRLQRGKNIHPLLATRGVPGTHDVALAIATINGLIAAKTETIITQFDKSIDDRLAPEQCQTIRGPVGLIILEGWCLGAPVQDTSELANPVNQLEVLEDPDAVWRTYVNEALAGDYQKLFGMVDTLLMLRAPSFDAIFQWRLEQEQKMTSPLMNETEIRRFILHYQRITEHCLKEMPSRVDYLYALDHNRKKSPRPVDRSRAFLHANDYEKA